MKTILLCICLTLLCLVEVREAGTLAGCICVSDPCHCTHWGKREEDAKSFQSRATMNSMSVENEAADPTVKEDQDAAVMVEGIGE